MKKIIAIVFAVLVVAAALFVYIELPKFTVTVPEAQPLGEIVWTSQRWTQAQRVSFHFTPQGTRLIPYAWFRVLEQPCFSISACEPFNDKTYLSRFGFLPGEGPEGLPIGFAVQNDFHDPISKATYPVVGLTCAACHTGGMTYGKYTVVVDGAPAMIEVTQFQKALVISMGLTQILPWRYSRFEKRVLGDNATADQKRGLKTDFDAFMKMGKWEVTNTDKLKTYVNQAGFIRTDALTRIGNQVFAVDAQNEANFAPANAPVRFPQIWDASWFTWVQYNSSISNPLVRNIGESLGVRAAVKLYGSDAGELDSSVDVTDLKHLEDLLAGAGPLEGLASPKWPEVFPALDMQKVAAGGQLYQRHCIGCHLPPVPELIADLSTAQPKYWWKNKLGKQFLTVKEIPVPEIGTDPHEAMDFIARTADTGDLKKGRVSAADGLSLVTVGIADNYFKKANFTPGQQAEWSGYRDPDEKAVRAPAVYKARPLNGIWAAAPYLHNGSVPNLYALLSPQNERPDSFWLGNKHFDPVKVGYEVGELKGAYLYKTDGIGNSNRGHEFRDGPTGKGVIGPALSPDDRWALIEYLKSLSEQ